MKDNALSLVADIIEPAKKLNLLREYIQAYILHSLHESEAFVNLSFVGGTALRFAFNLPRFSEDIDFSLENSQGYNPVSWMKKLKNDLSLAGFSVSVKWNATKAVHNAWVKVEGLLEEAGLAAVSNQKLSVKLEIDTRPPAGATYNKVVITRHVLFSLRYHDLPSLMAGKIHALVTRKYMKGRDWYDLLWYRGHRPRPEPNLTLLQNALDQTEGPDIFKSENWKEYLMGKIKTLNCKKLADDVRPFLERPNEAEFIKTENFLSVLDLEKE